MSEERLQANRRNLDVPFEPGILAPEHRIIADLTEPREEDDDG